MEFLATLDPFSIIGTPCNTQIHKYTDAQIHKYTDTQIHKYTDAQIHTSVLKGHWIKSHLAYSVKSVSTLFSSTVHWKFPILILVC